MIGRKGAGKTALYLALQEEANNEGSRCRALAFKQYPWATHARYAHNEVSAQEKFVASWTFLIYVELFQTLIEDPLRTWERHENRALGEVRDFLINNYGSTQFGFKEAFPAGGVRLKGGGARLGGGPASADATWERASESLGATLERINNWLQAKYEIVARNTGRIFILFDELDQGFDPKDENYVQRVVGLLVAVRSFTRMVKQAGGDVHAVAFLRTDIFDELHFGDKNKIYNAEVLELVWNDDLDYHDASLKQLIDHRIAESMGLSDETLNPWSFAFDPQVMVGTQHKFRHMTFRSFLRPRDVIHFANLALRKARQRIAAGQGPSLIKNEDVSAARPAYSNYFYLELDDEIGEADADWRNYLEVLKELRKDKFTSSEFASAFTNVRSKVTISKASNETLSFLYRYSIIGFERAVTGRGRFHQFKYEAPTVLFDPDADSFMVHRALQEELGITKVAIPEAVGAPQLPWFDEEGLEEDQ